MEPSDKPDAFLCQVVSLVYWREPPKSGAVLAAAAVALLCLANYSLISVVAYSGLLVLAATASARLYAMGLKMAGKGDGQCDFFK